MTVQRCLSVMIVMARSIPCVATAYMSCDGAQCDVPAVSAYVENHLSQMHADDFGNEATVDLLQHTSAFRAGDSQSNVVEEAGEGSKHGAGKCKRRCHYHPKHDCRLICRISCVTRKPVENPKCGKHATTTTTTSKEFSSEDPPTEDQTCNYASTLKTDFDTLKENTLGDESAQSPRLYFKNVVEMSKILLDKDEWKSRKFDLIVEDASQKPKYVNNPEKNIVSAVWEEKGLTKYVRDKRNYTGTYLGTVRIGLDNPGSFVFRFTVVDSETGQPAALPLFPLTFYDVDGEGEIVSTCDAARVISVKSKLEEKAADGCFIHHAQGREVNLPKDFEDLTSTQKAQSVTYVYANRASWDVQLHLEPSTPQRYFVMKSSNVLACTGQFDIEKGKKKEWKNKGQPKSSDA